MRGTVPAAAGPPRDCTPASTWHTTGRTATSTSHSRVGSRDPGPARRGSAALHPQPGGARGGRDPRRALERGAERAPPGGPDPQLPADALGEEGDRVDEVPQGGARHPVPAQQQVRARRPGPELRERNRLVLREVRSPLGAGERLIFGTVRYMSSENTARKVRVRRYLKTYRG
jgi:hypothetical protein